MWSGGEPWLVTAAHNFPAKCGEVPPCPAGKLLHECPHDEGGTPAYLAPQSTSPELVSTLTRWTQLTNNAPVKADAAAGWVNVSSNNGYLLSRRLAGFGKMVTGNAREPMAGEGITVISSERTSHILTGEIADHLMLEYDNDNTEICNSNDRVVFKELFGLEMNNTIPDGTSGGLVIDGNGHILGMFQAIGEINPRLGLAVRATNIQEALKFEKWVGSETVPLEGKLVSVGRHNKRRPTLRGWAYDPLNPNASLTVEVYADGPKEATETEQAGVPINWGTDQNPERTLTANQSHTGMPGTGHVSGQHGFQSGRIRSV